MRVEPGGKDFESGKENIHKENVKKEGEERVVSAPARTRGQPIGRSLKVGRTLGQVPQKHSSVPISGRIKQIGEGLPPEILIGVQKLNKSEQIENQVIKELQTKQCGDELPLASIQAKEDQETWVLWRGTSPERLVKMVAEGSAGGLQRNTDASKPTEKEIIQQVGEVAGRGLPEFTSDPKIAEGFGRTGVIVAIAVERKYLSQASGTEKGYVCKEDAPIEVLGWKQGKPIRTSSSS